MFSFSEAIRRDMMWGQKIDREEWLNYFWDQFGNSWKFRLFPDSFGTVSGQLESETATHLLQIFFPKEAPTPSSLSLSLSLSFSLSLSLSLSLL